ncbi:HEAT repeat domain-containing protein [Frondihabitans cladoniiphilus]|uniref:HEAT repeat domain-containing protein n=1 Tax=Frondihabitans cladoniiphilus TaxID=715785 RepID=A0ABP8VJ74_9MICO
MTALEDALRSPHSSARLQAVMAAGVRAEASDLDALIARCAIEPDFSVRDTLTWALTRIPRSLAVPAVVAELARPEAQARSQALHTLSKIGDPAAWPAVSESLSDTDDGVARAAWRAAVILAPGDERPALATRLAKQLGHGSRETQASLSRALVALGADLVEPLLARAAASRVDTVRDHAEATLQLLRDPDVGSSLAVAYARREVALGRTRSARG